MLALFRASPFQALNAVYPNRFKEWELNNVPNNFWPRENAIAAVKWVIDKKLFNRDSFQAIDAAYPGRFNPQEFKNKKRIIKP